MNILAWALYIKKALAAASAALIVTGEVFSDSELTGGYLPPSGEVLLLASAWLAVFGVYWFSNGQKPRKGFVG